MYAERLRASVPGVEARIAAALARAGRRDAVRVVAVTKGHPLEAVVAARHAGLAAIGENRVQELAAKRTAYPEGEPSPEWHLIGHLQRNKVRRAVELFDVIHSIDSDRLARELSQEAVRAGRTVRGLVQVNVSGETTKGGFGGADGVEAIGAVAALPGLRIAGLMTMAPLTDDTEVVRSTFVRTRELLERAVAGGAALTGRELSMGMSTDFEIAVEEGSTMVRLGTVLFGEREQ